LGRLVEHLAYGERVWLAGTTATCAGRACDDHRPTVIHADVRASLWRLALPGRHLLQMRDPGTAPLSVGSRQTVCDPIEAETVRVGEISNHPLELVDHARGVGPVGVVQHHYLLLHRAPGPMRTAPNTTAVGTIYALGSISGTTPRYSTSAHTQLARTDDA